MILIIPEKSEEETTAPGKSTLQYSEGNELSEWASIINRKQALWIPNM